MLHILLFIFLSFTGHSASAKPECANYLEKLFLKAKETRYLRSGIKPIERHSHLSSFYITLAV